MQRSKFFRASPGAKHMEVHTQTHATFLLFWQFPRAILLPAMKSDHQAQGADTN